MTVFGLASALTVSCATATPAEHVPGFEYVGVVASGRQANLVLTEGDPVEDHRLLRDPAWVILNGQAVSREELHAAYEASVSAWAN